MRLSQSQINGILKALTPFIQKNKGELRLYGSRLNDHAKGGDIDLLLIMEEPVASEKMIAQKHYLLSSMKQKIGDQKIDLTITYRSQITDDDFLSLIFPTSVLLHIWE